MSACSQKYHQHQETLVAQAPGWVDGHINGLGPPVIEVRREMNSPDSRTPPDVLRLSIGAEIVGDLIADPDRSLAA